MVSESSERLHQGCLTHLIYCQREKYAEIKT